MHTWNRLSAPMSSQGWMSWIAFVVICFIAAGLGSVATASSVKTWYPQLLKPPRTPPSWVFGPVWTMLYLLMATAAWVVWRHHAEWDVRLALALFFGQLALNTAWSFLFFGARRPGEALVEIVALLIAIAATTIAFGRVSRTAFWMMVPYLCWVGYATYLNLGIWRLNRGAP